MSTETQDHQEWVHLEAARELAQQEADGFLALYEIRQRPKKNESKILGAGKGEVQEKVCRGGSDILPTMRETRLSQFFPSPEEA